MIAAGLLHERIGPGGSPQMSSVEAATSPWWRDADGVLARVRGDAAVVREIIRGLEPADPRYPVLSEEADKPFVFLVETGT